MLELNDEDLIGRGLHRECYRHPTAADRCIKIIVNGDCDENTREAEYLEFLENRGASLEGLTRCHGVVTTNRGMGAVFDMVLDHDGAVSKTLEHYLHDEEFCVQNGQSLREALNQLHDYLLENQIITMTIKPKNVLFQRISDAHGRLVIVDNIGNSDFLPIANYVAPLARAKINRKWKRFILSLQSMQRGSAVSARIVAH